MYKLKRKFIFFMVLLIIALYWYYSPAEMEKKPDGVDILSINLKEHSNLALHIHPIISITILDENILIPPDIGISEAGMRVIHTHDETGKLHIESPYPHQFYLHDFFTIWGKNFNQSCIFNHCIDNNFTMVVMVNGIESENRTHIPFNDLDNIKITFREKISLDNQ